MGDRLEEILNRASRDAGLRMVRNINRAISSITPVRVRVEADLRAFGHSIDTLANFDPVQIPVNPDVDRAQFEAAINAALAGLEVSVRVVPDLTSFNTAITTHNTPTVNVNVDADTSSFDRAMSRLSGSAGRVGGALGGLLKFGAVGIAAAGAAQSVAGLVAALAPAAGLLAAGPAVILGYQAALGTLKLALMGVSESFSTALTGSAEEFEKSLENLSPAAQAVAREVRALKPAFEELRTSVQDAFFDKIEGDITRTAKALEGPLKKGLTEISAGWGVAAQGVLGYVQGARGVANIKSILDATGLSVAGLGQTTNKLTAGLLQAASAVSKAFGEELAGGISNAGQRFGEFLSESADNGQLVLWVDNALTVLAQLGDVLGNVGEILSGVFQAGNDVGAGFLNNLQMITQSMADFVNSAQGQEAIGAIFQTIGTIAAQLGPIFGALVTQVGAIAPALGPIFETLGPALVGLINALGPALAAIAPSLQAVAQGLSGAFAAIGPALGPVGEAIGGILSALSPLLPVIGQLVASVATALAPVLSALASALTPVITAISGALMPVLPILAEAFTTVATAVTPLIELIGATLGQVITAIAPLLATLATTFATIATALAPLIAQITDALVPLFAQLAPLIGTIVAALAPLIEQLVAALLPVLPPIIDAFTAIVAAIVPVIPVLAEVIAGLTPLIGILISVLAPVVQFAAEIIKWTAINVVVPVIEAVITVITNIIGAVKSVITNVSSFVTSTISFFSNLKTNVSNLVSGLVSAVVGFFQSLPGRARSAVSSIVGTLSSVFQSAKTAVVSRVTSLVSDAVSLVRGLPGKAKAALSNAASTLVSAGRDLIRGMINGVKAMAGQLVSAAKGVVKGAVDGAKDFLGISSPSKVFIEIGKFTGQGFVKGLQGTESQIKAAADSMVKKLTSAFKGKNTTLDDRLIRNVQATSKRLTALAKQRDAIANNIAEANKKVSEVRQAAIETGALRGLTVDGGIKTLTKDLNAAAKQVAAFDTQIKALASRGLRRDLLAQLVDLGPEQGRQLANTLSKATSGQIKELNDAQDSLVAASTRLGRDSADRLFDAGTQAAKGFLAGLKGQQKQVEDVMLQIARAMAKSIRSALGIKSPSKVFRQIGQYTMDGLSGGVADRLASVRRSVVGAASAITEPFGAGGSLGTIGVTGGAQTGAGGFGGSSSTRTVSPTFIINEVGDGEVTAQRVLNRLAMAGGGL